MKRETTMDWLPDAIAAVERELEVLDQRRGELEHAIVTLRKLAPAEEPAARKTKKRRVVKRRVMKRRAATSTPAEPVAREKAPGGQSRAGMKVASGDAVAARDAFILRRLKSGAATFSELLGGMPPEPGLNHDQRIRALSNALTRLRLKRDIKQDDDKGWALA